MLLRNLLANVDDEGYAMEAIAGIVKGARKVGCEELVKEGGVGVMVNLALGTHKHNRSKSLQCLSLVSGSLGPSPYYGPLLEGGIVQCFSGVVEGALTG